VLFGTCVCLAQIWYGDLAQTHKDGHQLRKRKAVEPKKADKKSASKQVGLRPYLAAI